MTPRPRPIATRATGTVTCWSTGSLSRSIATGTQPHTATAETRRTFATAVLEASDGNLLVTRDAGGWASAAVVEEIYAHVDIHDPVFDSALRKVWGETR